MIDLPVNEKTMSLESTRKQLCDRRYDDTMRLCGLCRELAESWLTRSESKGRGYNFVEATRACGARNSGAHENRTRGGAMVGKACRFGLTALRPRQARAWGSMSSNDIAAQNLGTKDHWRDLRRADEVAGGSAAPLQEATFAMPFGTNPS